MSIRRYLINAGSVAVAALLLAPVLPVAAQSSATENPRTADGRPDLSGIWQVLNSANWNLEPHASSQGAVESLGAIGAVAPGLGVVVGGQIPYLPEAAARRDENFRNRRTEDPEARCFRPGVPRATYMPYPFQIFQTDTDLFIAYQYAGAIRTIFMQDQVEAPVESWMGWSNGRWEGDTLVVDVAGLNGRTWLDRAGNFASERVRVVERFTPVGPNHIQYEATLDDPSVYSEPWTISMPIYRRIEPNARLLEFKCVPFAEELMYGYLRKPGTGADEEGGSDE